MGSRGRIRIVVAAAAVTLGLGFAAPAFAATIPDVTGLSASVDSAAVVTVQWDAYSSFGSGANPRLDAAVVGGGVTGNTCGAGLDAGATTCHFTATDSATYDVTVTPRTDSDSGLGADVTITVGLTAPSGSVSGLQAALDSSSNVVTVSWDPSAVNWGTGSGAILNVQVSGLPSASTCGQLPTSATSCHFTATGTTTYTITVTPRNDVGSGTASTVNIAVVAGSTPPNGAVDNLAAAFDAGTGLVTVSWTSANVAWGTGANRGFSVAISGGQVSGDGSNTCTGLLPDATSCQFRPTESATYTVVVTPTNDAGTGTRASADVAVTVSGQGGGASGGGTGGGVTGVGTTVTGGATSSATTGGGATLAATGRAILPPVLLGLALLLTGAGLVVAARLRRGRRAAVSQ